MLFDRISREICGGDLKMKLWKTSGGGGKFGGNSRKGLDRQKKWRYNACA